MATETKRGRAEPRGHGPTAHRDEGNTGLTGNASPHGPVTTEGAQPLPGPSSPPAAAPSTPTSPAARRYSPLASSPLAGATHALLRVGVGLLFMQHGAQKLFGLLGGVDGAGAVVPLVSQFGLAGVLEFFGGGLIVLGLLTRPVAVLLALEMVVAYFQAHAPQGGFPVENGGEPALLYVLAFAFLAGNGPGPWSLDRRLFPRLY